ncbi:uncharacterized protein RBU33_011389 isoform 3-T3 [Hipposideros larvatus]
MRVPTGRVERSPVVDRERYLAKGVLAMVYFIKHISVDYQDEIVTEPERSERHPGILDLALDGTLCIPFWGEDILEDISPRHLPKNEMISLCGFDLHLGQNVVE